MEVVMNEWDVTNYAAKDNLLRAVRREAEALFEMAENGPWTARTACSHWETRDIVGHLIDVTESYFTGFDAARSGTAVAEPLGLRVMAERLDDGAKHYRGLDQRAAVDRLRSDFEKMVEISEALGPDEWGGLQVGHKYMGPLPAFCYPTFQLVDYAVHGWDIRQGSGRAHALDGDTADLLGPVMFIVWQATADVPPDISPYTVGIRVSGRNAADYLVTVNVDGVNYARQDISDQPAVIEFDAGSLILTAYGRVNAGTIRGERAVADEFLNSFFRI
jgi:uncharacterized protein (TIGR03083 family)